MLKESGNLLEEGIPITKELLTFCKQNGYRISLKNGDYHQNEIQLNRSKNNEHLVSQIYHLCMNGELYPADYFELFGFRKSTQVTTMVREFAEARELPYIKLNKIYCKEILQKFEETNFERYGVPNATKSAEIKDKVRKTNLERYGVTSPAKSKEIQEKIKATNIERYGGASPLANEAVRKKTRETNLERYGVPNVLQDSEIRGRQMQTMMERYGVDRALKSEIFLERVKQTSLERYGVTNARKNPEIDAKISQTNLEKYGSESPFGNQEIQEKAINSVMGKYGVPNVFLNAGVQEKITQTLKDRYQIERKIPGGGKGIGEDFYLERFRETKKLGEKLKTSELSENERIEALTFLRENFCQPYYNHKARELGLKEAGTSIPEKMVRDFLKGLGIEFKTNDRKILQGNELDIFIPQRNLAIEVNGIAFHSVNRSIYGELKPRDYHFKKFKKCHESGITLLSFTDYELDHMWSSVTEIIKFHLGFLESLSESTRVEYQEFLGYPIEESLNYGFFNKNDLNFENFRLLGDFIVPRMLDGWEYWDCGRFHLSQ